MKWRGSNRIWLFAELARIYHALFLHKLCEIQVCDRPENDCSRRISVRDFATIRCIRFTEVSHRLNEYLVSLGLGRIGFGLDCPIFFIL